MIYLNVGLLTWIFWWDFILIREIDIRKIYLCIFQFIYDFYVFGNKNVFGGKIVKAISNWLK